MKNIPSFPIAMGLCFFVMFWQVFDSLALGIGLGVAMGAAFASTAKQGKESDCVSTTDSKSADD